MSQYLIDQIAQTENIQVCTGCSVVEVKGDDHLEALTIANASTGSKETVPAKSLFIFIGASPKPIGSVIWPSAIPKALFSQVPI